MRFVVRILTELETNLKGKLKYCHASLLHYTSILYISFVDKLSSTPTEPKITYHCLANFKQQGITRSPPTHRLNHSISMHHEFTFSLHNKPTIQFLIIFHVYLLALHDSSP